MSSENRTESFVRYCFCTLAFGSPYRLAAKHLAQQLHAQGLELFIVTDQPKDFKNIPGIRAKKLHRTSILYPYNDKRFALEFALQSYDCAALVDADSEICGDIPCEINVAPGMYAKVAFKSLEEDISRYHSANLKKFQKLAWKLGVDLQEAQWVCENLMILRKGEGRERIFLETWAFADRWLGLRRAFQGDHGYIGLSAAVAGYRVFEHPELQRLREVVKHQSKKYMNLTTKVYEPRRKLSKRVGFYSRLIKAYGSSGFRVKQV